MHDLAKVRRELENSLMIITHLEIKMKQMLRDQADYLAGRDDRLKELRERDRVIDDLIRRIAPIG